MLRIALITVVVVVISLLFTLMVFVMGMRPPKSSSPITPATYGLDYERVTVRTQDGLNLTGWFIHRPDTRAVVVVGHGYPFDKARILPDTLFLAKQFNLFYFDFRYFGESQGNFTTFGVDERQDLEAVLAYLRSRPEIDPQKMALYGFSLSAAIFAQNHPEGVRGMVLDSPFMSLKAITEQTYGFLGPFKGPYVWITLRYAQWFLGRDTAQASALKHIPQLTGPVLFIHGAADQQVPPEHSKALFAACGSTEKTFWLVPGAGHNQTRLVDPAVYETRVSDFFKECLR